MILSKRFATTSQSDRGDQPNCSALSRNTIITGSLIADSVINPEMDGGYLLI